MRFSTLRCAGWLIPACMAALIHARGITSIAAEQSTPDPLAARQELVRDRLLRLQDRMFRLSERLHATQPDQSERLVQGIHLANARQIRDRIDSAIQALRDGNIERASELQTQVSADLQAVLEALTNDAMTPEERRARIERLEQIEKELDALIEDQESARERANEAAKEHSGAQSTDGESKEEGLPTPDLDDQAQQQQKLSQEAGDLGERMSGEGTEPEGSTPDPSEPQSSPPQKATEPVDGAESVQRAARKMSQAAQKLQAGKPQNALPPQDEALKELEQAQREVQEQLEREREAEREEKLTSLEQRFRAMLSEQERISQATSELSQVPTDEWSRKDILNAAGLSRGEGSLAEDAAQAVHILEDDGTTVVFPEIVESVEEDMRQASALLASRRVDTETRRLQSNIESALGDLVDAVERQRQANRGAAGRGSATAGGGQLLPGSAELKLLASMQRRITDRTRETGGSNSDPGGETTRRLSVRQRRVAGLAGRMEESANRP